MRGLCVGGVFGGVFWGACGVPQGRGASCKGPLARGPRGKVGRGAARRRRKPRGGAEQPRPPLQGPLRPTHLPHDQLVRWHLPLVPPLQHDVRLPLLPLEQAGVGVGQACGQGGGRHADIAAAAPLRCPAPGAGTLWRPVCSGMQGVGAVLGPDSGAPPPPPTRVAPRTATNARPTQWSVSTGNQRPVLVGTSVCGSALPLTLCVGRQAWLRAGFAGRTRPPGGLPKHRHPTPTTTHAPHRRHPRARLVVEADGHGVWPEHSAMLLVKLRGAGRAGLVVGVQVLGIALQRHQSSRSSAAHGRRSPRVLVPGAPSHAGVPGTLSKSANQGRAPQESIKRLPGCPGAVCRYGRRPRAAQAPSGGPPGWDRDAAARGCACCRSPCSLCTREG